MNFPHTATIRRTTKVGTKYTYGDAGTTKCFVQPIDMESAQAFGITFSKGSVCYLPFTSDVAEGDELVVEGVTYSVSGIRTHDYGNLAHKKAALERT